MHVTHTQIRASHLERSRTWSPCGMPKLQRVHNRVSESQSQVNGEWCLGSSSQALDMNHPFVVCRGEPMPEALKVRAGQCRFLPLGLLDARTVVVWVANITIHKVSWTETSLSQGGELVRSFPAAGNSRSLNPHTPPPHIRRLVHSEPATSTWDLMTPRVCN